MFSGSGTEKLGLPTCLPKFQTYRGDLGRIFSKDVWPSYKPSLSLD